MEKKKHFNKKELKKRLACISMIYMDGLNERKNEKLRIYLECKLGKVVDYYVALLRKKELATLVSLEHTPEMIIQKLNNYMEKKSKENTAVTTTSSL